MLNFEVQMVPHEKSWGHEQYLEVKEDWASDNYDPTRYVFQLATHTKDKKGRMIFEGDIVKIESKYSFEAGTFEVRYSTGFAAFSLYNLDKAKWREHTDESERDGWDGVIGSQGKPESKIEIIGNIYDNPELLKND